MLNKPHNRTEGMASTMLSMPSGWGSTFGAISFYYDKGASPSHSIIIGIEKGRDHHASNYSYIQE